MKRLVLELLDGQLAIGEPKEKEKLARKAGGNAIAQVGGVVPVGGCAREGKET